MKTTVRLYVLVFPALALVMLLAACTSTESESENALTVLNPQGPVDFKRNLAPRLDTLQGKKIALWLSATEDQLFAGKGSELYELLEAMFKDNYPDTEIVSYTDLPMKFSPENEVLDAILAAEPDGVVAGFGG